MHHQHVTLPIYNLDCGGNTATVERVIAAIPGVTQVYVNPATEMAYVQYDAAQADTNRITAALVAAGFGPVNSKQPAQQISTAPEQISHRLDGQRLALAAGILVMAIYVLCVVADLLFPNLFQMYRFWEVILIGVQWTVRWTLLLGLVETFLYGAISGWAFVALYNALPARRPRQRSA